MALSIWKMMGVALVFSLIVFLEVFAGAIHNEWIILTIFVPVTMTPLPLLLLKCCSSDGGVFSSGPRGLHWAQFGSGFFFTGVFALPIILFSTNIVQHWETVFLALLGVCLALCGACGGSYLAARADSDSYTAW
jgi:hypothetical protein